MKIDLLDTSEFVDINHLVAVTSPVLFEHSGVPNPNGLVSNTIFGVTPKDRKQTFAYIDLSKHFFQPHVYKIIKRFFRNVERIVSGTEYYVINENGHLVVSTPDKGETGINFLYDNWEKIKWEYGDSTARNERIDLVTKCKKSEIFLNKLIVIPAFYRDITSSDGRGQVPELDTFYVNIIRLVSILREDDTFGFSSLYGTEASVQRLLVDVYDYFKGKLESKNGLIRKYLMGKNVDYCTRSVITAGTYHASRPEELEISLRYSGIPIHQILSLCQPFIIAWLKNFFQRELSDNIEKELLDPKTGRIITLVQPKNVDTVFTDKYFNKRMDAYVRDPESRFDPIEVPLTNGKTAYMVFHGKRFDMSNKDELASISTRKMTWTDVFYMACDDVCKDKHSLITRYPLLDQYSIFPSRVRVTSTSTTIPMQVGEKIYPYYPNIKLDLPKSKIITEFVDSVRFSNSYLPGLDGDYDGDQVTVKIIWTQQANAEIEKQMNSKSFFINSNGKFIRYVELEAIQTFFNLTKEPTIKNKTLTSVEAAAIYNLDPKQFTFEKIVELLGVSHHKDGDYPKYYPEDRLTIPIDTYNKNKEPINTTVGRLLFNKIIFQGIGLDKIFGYFNDCWVEKSYFAMEAKLSDLLIMDQVTTEQMYQYVDTRDWFSLQCHVLITPSFTPDTIKIHPEVQKLKNELLKKYKKEIESGDARIAEVIENALLKKTKEVFKNDPGMDLYNSGARGSLSNNYKNIALMRGAVYNRATDKFEIVTNSLNDGLDIKDIPISSNTILEGAYPKAVGTQDSGYMAKQLLAYCQTESLDDKGSDCGSKRGIPIVITDRNKRRYAFRYIIENGKLVQLTEDNVNKYVGKIVELRSPFTCIHTKNGKLCNVCCGDYYYRLGNSQIGLSAMRIGNDLTRLNMKKFHDNVIHFSKIDLDDMFV